MDVSVTSPLRSTAQLMTTATNEPTKMSLVSSELHKPTPTIDINVLRERSKHLDLPLISALCNDRTLLKQTVLAALNSPTKPATMTMSPAKGKYIDNGSTAALTADVSTNKSKTVISHRHPNDKLPPLPLQRNFAGNNYVIDPALKHKSFSSQPNLRQA